MTSIRSPEGGALESLLLPGWQRLLLALGVSSVVVLLSLGDSASGIAGIWQRSSSYQYGWLVVPTVIYLLWHNRDRLADVPLGTNLVGLGLAAIMGIAWVLGDAAGIALVGQLALVGGLGAIVLTALGLRMSLALGPYFALLLLAVPLGNIFLQPLKHLTVGMIEVFCWIVGLPVVQEGFTLTIDGQRYVVIDDCAGLGYFLLGLFFGLTLGLLIYRHPLRIAAMAILGASAGILANGLRVSGIVWLDHLNGTQMDLAGHAYVELPAVAIMFVALFVVFSRLKGDSPSAELQAPVSERQMPQARAALLALLASLIMIMMPLGWQALPAPQNPSLTQADPFPAVLGQWHRSEESHVEWHPSVPSDGVNSFRADYILGDEAVGLFFARVSDPGGKVSGGAVELVGDRSWMLVQSSIAPVCNDAGCIDAERRKLLLSETERIKHIYVVYGIGNEVMNSVLKLRLRRAWTRLTAAPQDIWLLAINSDEIEELSEADLADIMFGITKR